MFNIFSTIFNRLSLKMLAMKYRYFKFIKFEALARF